MNPDKRPLLFHLMAKPTGPRCNLACRYCFYLPKESLYPDSRLQMSESTLEEFTRQYIESQGAADMTFTWQGGEPMLMGLDFFQEALYLQQKYTETCLRVHNTIQTNGTLLTDEWCEFFRINNFLVGISLDGPRELHDIYRVDRKGQPTFDKVMNSLGLLKEHRVQFNILSAVHNVNSRHPLEVYRFLRDEIGSKHLQFIPIVEPVEGLSTDSRNIVSDRSVTAKQYGAFLTSIFDEWVKHDVGQVFVQHFDVSLAAWVGSMPSLCVFSPICGSALVIEHNGDVYSCDHFVDGDHLLGNINEASLSRIVTSTIQHEFGRNKYVSLPSYCHECDVRFACNGGCPKNRLIKAPDGEPGLNYLCESYEFFFHHIDEPMRIMATLLARRRAPSEIMAIM